MTSYALYFTIKDEHKFKLLQFAKDYLSVEYFVHNPDRPNTTATIRLYRRIKSNRRLNMKSVLKNRKGSLNMIVPAILALTLAASILVFGLIISEKLRDTTTAGSAAYTAANKTVVGLGTFADFWSIIVLAVVIAVVVGLLLMVLSARRVE